MLYGVLLQTSRAGGREAGVRARSLLLGGLGLLDGALLGALERLGRAALGGRLLDLVVGRRVHLRARGCVVGVRACACARACVDETVCVRVCARVCALGRARAIDDSARSRKRATVFARSHLELLLEELDVLRVGRVHERERVARAARRLQRGVAVERVDDLRVGARLLRLAEAQLAVQRRAPVDHLRRRGQTCAGARTCKRMREPA